MARRNISNAVPALRSWAGLDELLRDLRLIEASIEKREAEKHEDLAALEDRCNREIVPLVERRDALARAAEDFVAFHREDLGDARSKRLNHGVVGFRLGQRALKTLSRWTWKKVLAKLEEARLRPYIAVKTSVDRAAILKSGLDAAQLKVLGLRVVQEDRFYIETPGEEVVAPT